MEADLADAKLIKSKLTGANLSNANLTAASLSLTSLNDANLNNTYLWYTKFCNQEFGETRNITPEQIKKAKNWEKAVYSPEFRKKLGLTPEE